MEALSQPRNTSQISIFLIGNNPIDLGSIYDKIKAINSEEYRTEIGFELKGLYNRIRKFRPSCIFIDDNLQKVQIKKILKRLASNSETRDIPITVIKNSNYSEGYSEAQDYLLKEKLTSEKLYRTIKNSMRLKRMQLFIIKKYRKNKSLLAKLLNN